MLLFERLRLWLAQAFTSFHRLEPARRPRRRRCAPGPTSFVRQLEPRRVLSADVVANQQFLVAENAAAGTVVGTVETTPQADPTQPLTYSITAGNPSNAFLIVPNSGEIQVANPDALDFEASPEWQLTIGVQGAGESSPGSSAIVTIHLTDVYAPATVHLSGGEATLSLVNGNLHVQQGGATLFDAPTTDVSSLTIIGSSAAADHLIVDLTNGNPIPTGGLLYDGGDQPAGTVDAVELRGESDSVDYRYDNANDGGITVTQGITQRTIEYRNLEPVVNTGTANSAVFTLSAGDDVAVLEFVSGNTLRLRSVNGTFETTTFTAPTVSLTIRTGDGNDDLTIASLNASFRARLIIDGQVGADDHVAINTALTLGVAGGSNGDLTVTAERIDVTQAINTTAGSSGDVTFNAATKLTLSDAADITTKGTVTVTGGAVETAGDVTTTGDLVRISAPTKLTGNVALATANGNVDFNGLTATVNGGFKLTITAGTGNVSFDAAVGNIGPLKGVNVVSAKNVNFANTAAVGSDGIQLTTSGTADFTGAVTTTAGGSVTVTNTGVLTVGGKLDLDGTFLQNGAGRTDLGADVTTTADAVTIQGSLKLIADATITTTGGEVQFQQTVDGSRKLTVAAGNADVIFQGAVGGGIRVDGVKVTSAKNVAFQSSVAAGAAGLDLTASGAVDFTAGVNTTNSGAATISHGGQLTIPGAADFDLAGAFSESGGGAVQLGGDIATTADPITFGDQVTLTGDVALKSTGGDVRFQNTLDGDKLLTVTAGIGNVNFDAAVGGTTPLSGLQVVSAKNLSLQTLKADDQGIQLKATGTVDLNGPVTTTSDGVLTVTNTGVLSIKADLNLAGAFLQNGIGRTDLGADITTTSDAVTFGGAVKLTDDAQVTTAGGTVDFQGKLDGAKQLTVAAGSGDVTFAQQVGSGERVDGIEVTSARNVAFDKTVSLESGGLKLTTAGTVDLKQALDTTVGGAVTITNTGLLTVAGNLNLDGALTQNGTGNVLLSADATTTGDAVDFLSPVELVADVAITTAGGQVHFQNTVDGGQLLSITAGAGDVDFDAAVGNTTSLDGLKVVSAHNVSFATALKAGDRDVSLTASNEINLNGLVTTVTGGTVTLNNGGILKIAADLNLDGVFLQNGTGEVQLGGNVTTTADDVTFQGPTKLTTDVTLTTAGGNVHFDGTAATVDGDKLLTITADTGDVTFEAAVGGATPLSGLFVNSARNVAFNQVLKADDQGIQLTTSGTVDLTGPVTTTNNGALTVTNTGVLTVGGKLDLDGAFLQNGAGRTDLAADVTTTGDDVTVGGPLKLTADAKITTADGKVWLKNTIDGASQLTIAASAGDVRIDGAAGGTTRVDGIQITSAKDVAFYQTVKVAGNGLDLTASGAVDFAAGVNTTNSGAVTISHGGQLTIPGAADFDLAGAFNESGGGAVQLGGDIATTADPITFGDQVTLTGDVALKSTGGDVRFQNTLDGDKLLTVTAGIGNVNFDAAVGGTTPLSGLQVVSAKNLAFQTLKADDQGIQLKATGTVDLNGPVTTTSDGVLTVTNTGVLSIKADLNLAGAFLQNGIGRTDLGADITTTSDAVTFGGAVKLTDDAQITTAGGNVDFQGKLDGAKQLTVAAGSGDVTFAQQVGSGERVDGIEVTSARNVAFDKTVSLESGGLKLTTAGTVDLKQALDTTVGGAVTITNTGVLTVAGNLNLDGALTQNGTGNVLLSADVTTTGDAVDFLSPVELGADVDVETAGGNVRFRNTVDGKWLLTIAAGATGDVQFDAAVGGTTPLDGLNVASAHDVLFAAALTVRDRDLSLTAANKITLNGEVKTLDGGIVTIDSGGELAIAAAADLNLTGAFLQSGSGPVTLQGDITTDGDAVTFNGPTTLPSDVVITTAGGDLKFAGTAATVDGGGKLTVSAGTGDVDFDAAVGNTTPLSGLVINTARNVTFDQIVKAAAGGIQLTTTGTIDLTGGATTTAGGGLTATNGGVLTINGPLQLDGALVQNGAGRTDLAADVTTTGDDVTIGGPLKLTADAKITTADGSVQFQQTVDGPAHLTIDAGAGTVEFVGAIGNTRRPDGVTIAHSGGIDFQQTVKIDGGGLDLTSADMVKFAAAVDVNLGGAVRIDNAGLLSIPDAADFTLTGSFSQVGTGPTSLAGDIKTTNDAVSFNGAVTLATNAAGKILIDAGVTGADVTFASTVDATTAGAENLQIDAGTGNVRFGGAVGGVKSLGDVVITKAHDVDIVAGLQAKTLTHLRGSGTTTFGGATTLNTATGTALDVKTNSVNIDAAVKSTGGDLKLAVDDLAINTISGSLNATSTGIVTVVTKTFARELDLGLGTAAGKLDISAAEFDRITAKVLRVGDARSGSIDLSAPIAPIGTSILHLQTGGDVSGNGTIKIAQLAVEAVGDVNLSNVNDVDTLAIHMTGTGKHLSFQDDDGVELGKVDDVSGIQTVDGNATLRTGGAVTQTTDGNIDVAGLELLGDGPVTLANSTNSIEVLAASLDGSLSLRTQTALKVGTVQTFGAATTGVTTSDDDVTLQSGDTLTLESTVNVGAANVQLTTDAGAIDDPGGAAAKVVAKELAMSARTGIGVTQALQTNVEVLAAENLTSGKIAVADQSGSLLTVGTTGGITGLKNVGNGGISLTHVGPMTVTASVTDAGGGVTLSTSANGGDDDHLELSAQILVSGGAGDINLFGGTDLLFHNVGVLDDVRVAGSGSIIGDAGRNIVLDSDVRLRSATGAIENIPPLLTNVAGPQIQNTGAASVSFDYGRLQELNFQAVINWGDGAVDAYTFTPPGSATVGHTYTGNPNALDPAAPIPVSVTLNGDSRIHLVGHETTTVQIFLDFPGDGVKNVRIDTTPKVPLLSFPQLPRVTDTPAAATVTTVRAAVDTSGASAVDAVETTERVLILREVLPDGREGSSVQFAQTLLDDLSAIFGKLRNGRYRLYLFEPETQTQRMTMEVYIRDGKPVSLDAADESRGNQPDGAQIQPPPGEDLLEADSVTIVDETEIEAATSTDSAAGLAATAGLVLVAATADWSSRVDAALARYRSFSRLRAQRRQDRAASRFKAK